MDTGCYSEATLKSNYFLYLGEISNNYTDQERLGMVLVNKWEHFFWLQLEPVQQPRQHYGTTTKDKQQKDAAPRPQGDTALFEKIGRRDIKLSYQDK